MKYIFILSLIFSLPCFAIQENEGSRCVLETRVAFSKFISNNYYPPVIITDISKEDCFKSAIEKSNYYKNDYDNFTAVVFSPNPLTGKKYRHAAVYVSWKYFKSKTKYFSDASGKVTKFTPHDEYLEKDQRKDYDGYNLFD
ncbi:MAG: hypothetical protein KAQ98_13775 [Bacteriovoracaceae bacterium]|nr:hypothetical protein [Bacteriovoracaceae bacterium]